MRGDLEKVLFDEPAIHRRLDDMAAQISNDYRDRELTVIAVLHGSLMFVADLLRRIPLPLKLDCLSVASYRGKAQSSGEVVFKLATASPSGGGHGAYRFLAQGTLYPDVIESVSIGGNPSQVIKTHHNVGGLPAKMHFELVEPVRQLFKDEVRQVGLQLGLPKEIVYRQPFPGPGLAVRILGEVTSERLSILREADTIVQSEMEAADWYYKVWQSFAVLLPIQTVGVMGDQRTYENTIALRIVESQDGMTADWVRVPYEILARISSRISNEVNGVNRVVFDISSKPPSTIEWE